MATQLNQRFIGRIGNLIYYEWNGGYYIRTVPERVNQHPASKPASSNLAIASNLGKRLRMLLQPVLPAKKTRDLQNRLAGGIMRWLNQQQGQPVSPGGELTCLQHFLFNEATSISARWKIKLPVNRSGNILQLHLPAFVPKDCISAPAHTTLVECSISAAACLLQKDGAMSAYTYKMDIPYNAVGIAAQTIDLPVDIAVGSWVVVAVALTYITEKKGALYPAKMPHLCRQKL